jgi:hypothetical protein
MLTRALTQPRRSLLPSAIGICAAGAVVILVVWLS